MKNKKPNSDKDFYNGKSKKEWIAWAKREVKEYEKFIEFLEKEEK